MTTFHSRPSDCNRRTRKNENAGTFNFMSQIASSICTVAIMKPEKSDAIIFTSRCIRSSLVNNFMRGQALLLNFVRFFRLAQISPMSQRRPAWRSRDGRESSGKKSGKMSRVKFAQHPVIGRAVAAAIPLNVCQDDSQDNSDMDAQPPRRKLARQFAGWSCNDHAVVHATTNATTREQLAGFSPTAFNHLIQRL